MATRGVFQLQKLKLHYCEVGGSSRSLREFISSGRVVQWAEDHPHITVELKVRNGHHPYIAGDYLTGPSKQIGIKNEPLSRIYEVMDVLKNSSGRKIKRLSKPVVTQTPSVQGIWTPMLDLQDVTFPMQIINKKESP